MTWIKMRTDLAADPRVARIANQLGVPIPHAVGLLHRFWSWADGQTEDGWIAHATTEFIDGLLETSGFCEALTSVRWFEEREGGVWIPNFRDHNGQSAKKRARDALRKSASRAQRPPSVQHVSDAHADTMRTPSGPEQNRSEREEERDSTAAKGADVDALNQLLGSADLATHSNATPERIAWILAEAPSKKNPAGWAADAIRKGWDPPADFAKRREVADRDAERRNARNFLHSLPPEHRAVVTNGIMEKQPRLRLCTDLARRDEYVLDKIVEQGLHESFRVGGPA